MDIQQVNRVIGNYGEFTKYSRVFIETGSCYGRSIQLASMAGYEEIRSVEAKEEYYNHCQQLVKDWLFPTVKLYLGKSIDRLSEMIADLDRPAVLFLDAHVSGEASAGYEDWVEKQEKSDYHQDRVLEAEIKIILAHRQDHVFIIDDQNGEDIYAHYIESLVPGKYKFFFYDEQMGLTFYKNKMLIAIPNA